MNALSQAKGADKLGRGLQTLAMAAMPFGLAQLSGITGAQSLGKPDPTALNDMISQQHAAMGTYSGMTPEEIDQNPMGNLDALSMQAYGMSLSDKARDLGMGTMEFAQVAFTPGYKNGQVDPTTGNTYSYGQAGDPFGVPSYGSITDFGKAMTASAETGFYGSLATAKAIATDPTKTDKEKEKAIAFGNKINPFFSMDIDERGDEEVGKDLDAIGKGVQTQADKERGFNVNETFGTGTPDDGPTGGGFGFGTSTVGDDPSTEDDDGVTSDDGPSSDTGTESADTPGDSQGPSGGVGDYKIGGLAGKKKPKVKKMKRGGLASR